jgi:hypothetical protein
MPVSLKDLEPFQDGSIIRLNRASVKVIRFVVADF